MCEEKKDYLMDRLREEAARFAVSVSLNKGAYEVALETLVCLESGTYSFGEASEILSYLKSLRL